MPAKKGLNTSQSNSTPTATTTKAAKKSTPKRAKAQTTPKRSKSANKQKLDGQMLKAAAKTVSMKKVDATQPPTSTSQPTATQSNPQPQPHPETQNPSHARFKYQRKAKAPISGYVINYVEPASPNSEDTTPEESSNSSASLHDVLAVANTTTAEEGDAKLQKQSSTPKSRKRAKSHKHKKHKKKKYEAEVNSDSESVADEVANARQVGLSLVKKRMNGMVIATSCVENANDAKAGAESNVGVKYEDGAKPPLTTTIKFNMKGQSGNNAKKTKNSNAKKHKRHT